jgi:hypothetical protein
MFVNFKYLFLYTHFIATVCEELNIRALLICCFPTPIFPSLSEFPKHVNIDYNLDIIDYIFQLKDINKLGLMY